MSIRIGIYDFFANMIPGVFYILVTAFGLTIFGIVDLDLFQIQDISLFGFVTLLAAGFILGQMLDMVAYKWFCLFKKRNRFERKEVFASFQQKYPWIEINYRHEDWLLMLHAIRIQIPEAAMDIEQQHAIHIMLRNISLSLFLTSLILLFAFFIVHIHIGSLALAALAAAFSYLAIDRAANRRRWFYMGIYEAFVTNLLLQQKKLESKIDVKQVQPNVVTDGKEMDEG